MQLEVATLPVTNQVLVSDGFAALVDADLQALKR
jgi:hypothetical protein